MRENAPRMTKLLVVDDDPALSRTLRRALAVEGYAVDCAADGQEALDRMGAAEYDAVVLDVSMPRVDGLAVCRRLRDRRDRTPVLMLTARDEVRDRVSGLDAGAGDLTLDLQTFRAARGGRALELTRTEHRLLELFLRNPEQVLPRDVIYERVWGFDISLTSNSLDVYVGYLRRKTEEDGEPRAIQTVRGVGFMLTA
jgi:two-component system response regulator MprA